MSERPTHTAADSERLTALITEHQRELYLYIWSLVHHSADAQDVLQETNLALWRDIERSAHVVDFRSWACRVAYNQVLAYRKRCVRDRLHFDDALLGQLAVESERQAAEPNDWQLALRDCSQKLPLESRQMLSLRYCAPCSVQAIAKQLGRSVASISQSLYRIRSTLLRCIHETLASRALQTNDPRHGDIPSDHDNATTEGNP